MWDDFTLSEFSKCEASVLFWSPQPKPPLLLCLSDTASSTGPLFSPLLHSLLQLGKASNFLTLLATFPWGNSSSQATATQPVTQSFLLLHQAISPFAWAPAAHPSPSPQENLWLHLCTCSFSSKSSYLSSTLRAHWLRPQFSKEFYHTLKCSWLRPSICF